MELYICIIVVLSIVVGIPTCIKSMEFILMFKFCRKFDEDENAYTGGVTICEFLTNLFTKKPKEEQQLDDVVELQQDYDEANEDEYAGEGEKENVKAVGIIMPETHSSSNKCVVCCRAVFCCKAQNTVSRQQELN
jgi:hypothetical protein